MTDRLPHVREPSSGEPDVCLHCREEWVDLLTLYETDECPVRLRAEVERLRAGADEARRAERAEIVAWLRQEAARYRRLEPVLSPAARALESVAYLIETHAPHAVDLPESGRHSARERGNNER